MRTSVVMVRTTVALGLVTIGPVGLTQERLASPPGQSATQVGGGTYDERAGYVGGQWIEIRYGRPIKRGRDLFGPSDYVDFLNDGAPIWRAGANATTRLLSEVALTFGTEVVPPGEYTVFIELDTNPWTFIISTWPAQQTYDQENTEALFGAYEYTPDRDIVRVPMTRETLPYSFDQLSWQFLDISNRGGRLALLWDATIASVAFTVE